METQYYKTEIKKGRDLKEGDNIWSQTKGFVKLDYSRVKFYNNNMSSQDFLVKVNVL